MISFKIGKLNTPHSSLEAGNGVSVGSKMWGYLVVFMCAAMGAQGRPIRSIPKDIYLSVPIDNLVSPPTTPISTAFASTTTKALPDIFLSPTLILQTGEEEETPSSPTFNTFTHVGTSTGLPGNSVPGDAEMASKMDQSADGLWSMLPISWRLFLRGKLLLGL